jgi:hypothetical protein
MYRSSLVRLPTECLNQNWFLWLEYGEQKTAPWRLDSTITDHTALWVTWPPGEFAQSGQPTTD